MTRKIRALALAIVAMGALGAVGASTASAGSLDPAVQPSVITGEQTSQMIFTLKNTTGQVTVNGRCPVATLEGTLQGQTDVTEATVTATYSADSANQCKFGLQSTTVAMNGCKYTITGAGEAALTATLDIVGCTTGEMIEIEANLCTVTIPEQNGLSHVTFENMGGPPKDVTAIFTISEVTVFQDGMFCPDGDKHHSLNGSIQGTTTIKAFEDALTIQVQKHNHQYTEHVCDKQVDLVAT